MSDGDPGCRHCSNEDAKCRRDGCVKCCECGRALLATKSEPLTDEDLRWPLQDGGCTSCGGNPLDHAPWCGSTRDTLRFIFRLIHDLKKAQPFERLVKELPELKDWSKRLAKLVEMHNAAQDRADELQARNDALEAEDARRGALLTKGEQAMVDRNAELEAGLVRANELYDTAMAERNDARKGKCEKCEAANKDIEKLRARNTTLEAELDSVTAEAFLKISTLTREKTPDQNDVAALNRMVRDAKKMLDDLQAKLTEAEEERDRRGEIVTQVCEALDTEWWKSAAGKARTVIAQLDKAQTANFGLKARIEGLVDALKRIQADHPTYELVDLRAIARTALKIYGLDSPGRRLVDGEIHGVHRNSAGQEIKVESTGNCLDLHVAEGLKLKVKSSKDFDGRQAYVWIEGA